MKIYAVMVVYNKHLSECPSFCSAKSQSDVQLLVVDNSTDESVQNQEEARQAGAWFLSMNGNKGLSKAYNAAFNMLRKKPGDWIVLLDDDTEIPDEYWVKLRMESPDAILLPVVMTANGKMISPAEMKHDIPHLVHSTESITEITGINSGMAIPKRLADSYSYDERLFLDYVDHQFLKDMKNSGEKIKILPTNLKQAFSADILDLAAAVKRLKIQKSDLLTYYSTARWKARYLIFKRKLHLAVQLRYPGVLWNE